MRACMRCKIEKRDRLVMNASETFLMELLPTRKEEKNDVVPTHNCDLTCKEKRKKMKRANIRNRKDVDVADHSL
jgi:hypothetical protein